MYVLAVHRREKWSRERSTEKAECSKVQGSEISGGGITRVEGVLTTALKLEGRVVRSET